MSTNDDLYIALGYCALILLFAIIYKIFPPKNINYLYGYRTRRSMKNQTVWRAANQYAARYFIIVSVLSFILVIFAHLWYPQEVLLITITGNCILLILILPLTENYLKNNF